jgi:hypothetical protein
MAFHTLNNATHIINLSKNFITLYSQMKRLDIGDADMLGADQLSGNFQTFLEAF